MTLRRKMTLQIAAMIGGLLLVIAASLWGLNGLRSDFGVATSGYRAMRDVYEVAGHVATAKTLLAAGDRPQASDEMSRAVVRLDLFLSHQAAGIGDDESKFSVDLQRGVAQAAAAVNRRPVDANIRPELDAMDNVLGQVTRFAMSVRESIQRHEAAANMKWRATLILVAVVSAIVVIATIGLAIRQYRGVVQPLTALGKAADHFARGRLSERIDTADLQHGASEFCRLAEAFNRMAGELETLYKDLEQKVADKSRELVRSERLASVGYLAAGVAHEINNPLSVITGYGERATQRLHRNGDPDEATLTSLSIMCEEAYRCKAITERLLSLARPGEVHRSAVGVATIAREVMTLVQGLPLSRGKNIRLTIAPDAAGATVIAAQGEIKQVLLNLILNALDAVTPAGNVNIDITTADAVVRIIVADDGRGMTTETLGRIFEPFFTEKRGVQAAGTGLGLSISHTIVESHAGRLTAASDGPNRGSQLKIELPLSAHVEAG